MRCLLSAVQLALLFACRARAEAEGRRENGDRTGLASVVKALMQVVHENRAPAPVVLLDCRPGRGGRALSRALSDAGIAAGFVARPEAWLPSLKALGEADVSVVLDTACPEAPLLLAEADRLDMFRSRRRWMLVLHDLEGVMDLDLSSVPHPDKRGPDDVALEQCRRRAGALLHGLAVLLDSDVSVVCMPERPGAPRAPMVLSAHRVWRGAELKLQQTTRWQHGPQAWIRVDRRAIAARRLDMDGYAVNAAFVVYNKADLKVNIAEGRLSADFFTSFFWDMVHDMVRMLNGTTNVTIANTWGFVPKGVPTEGIFGMQIHNQAEIGGTGYSLILDPLRQKYLTYTNFFCPASGVIVFRAPPISYEHNVFALPFPLSLWEASAGMVAVCVVLLMVALRVEQLVRGASSSSESDEHALHSGSDALLVALAAVCQQGSPVDTNSVPGRIISLMLFLLVLLLYTCYSASIVVLLQSTSSNLHHYKDLLNSRITLGTANVSYVKLYLSTETDPVRQRVFREKVMDRGRKANFYSYGEGVRRAQHEYFAFFGVESNIYEEIARTWQEHEKCGLVGIGRDFLRVRDPQLTITKTSHNTEAFMIMLRRLTERGIWHRMTRKFVRSKPVCSNRAAVFNSVSLTDCRGAFYVLTSLMAASLLVLLVELAVHRREGKKKRKAEATRIEVAVATNRTWITPAFD